MPTSTRSSLLMPVVGWRPGLSPRELASLIGDHLLMQTTGREVEAIEYVGGDGRTWCQVGALEEHDGTMWSVAGIYEPALPHAPWVIALVARRGSEVVLRMPGVFVRQPLVTRVHDADLPL